MDYEDKTEPQRSRSMDYEDKLASEAADYALQLKEQEDIRGQIATREFVRHVDSIAPSKVASAGGSAPPQSIEILLDEWQESMPATATVGEWDYNDLIEFGRFVQAKSTPKIGRSAPEQDVVTFVDAMLQTIFPPRMSSVPGCEDIDENEPSTEMRDACVTIAIAYAASTREPLELKPDDTTSELQRKSILGLIAKNDAAEREIERLKAALYEIRQCEFNSPGSKHHGCIFGTQARTIIDRALSDAAPPNLCRHCGLRNCENPQHKDPAPPVSAESQAKEKV